MTAVCLSVGGWTEGLYLLVDMVTTPMLMYIVKTCGRGKVVTAGREVGSLQRSRLERRERIIFEVILFLPSGLLLGSSLLSFQRVSS